MKIARFEPWPYVDVLNRQQRRTPRSAGATEWVPAVDIIEEKGHFLLRADVPGVAATDIELSMDGGVLTVSGVRHREETGEDAGVQRAERSSGRFLRRFTLPETVDTDRIAAKTRHGILEVSIPKIPEVQARRITVEAA